VYLYIKAEETKKERNILLPRNQGKGNNPFNSLHLKIRVIVRARKKIIKVKRKRKSTLLRELEFF